MNDLSRKIVLAVIAVLVTVGVIYLLSIGNKKTQKSELKNIYRSVRVDTVELQTHVAEVEFTGKLAAVDKIEIYTEVGGVLLNDSFREGNSFSKGSVIAQLDAREFANNLKAQKTQLVTQVSSIMGDLKLDFEDAVSEWEKFLNEIDVEKPLPKLPLVSDKKLKRFISGKGILNSYYNLKSQEEKLSKFILKAPFNGVLTEANIKKGTLVRGGQKIGAFINPFDFELETEVSLSDLQFIGKGTAVSLLSTDLNKTFKGVVSRLNSSVNPSTQMVKIYVNVQGADLKEGMFLSGIGKGASFENSALLNRKLVKNGGVYVVDSNKVKFRKVEVKYVNQSKAIVTGLNSGEAYVADNMKGLYEGMQVSVAK